MSSSSHNKSETSPSHGDGDGDETLGESICIVSNKDVNACHHHPNNHNNTTLGTNSQVCTSCNSSSSSSNDHDNLGSRDVKRDPLSNLSEAKAIGSGVDFASENEIDNDNENKAPLTVHHESESRDINTNHGSGRSSRNNGSSGNSSNDSVSVGEELKAWPSPIGPVATVRIMHLPLLLTSLVFVRVMCSPIPWLLSILYLLLISSFVVYFLIILSICIVQFDPTQPTSSSGGKSRAIAMLMSQHDLKCVIMVGDGATGMLY